MDRNNDNGDNTASTIDYGAAVEKAMRGVVKDVMVQIVPEGLPGEHHFYITFQTTHPGVIMPDHLRALYNEEMTIVLQHQFRNLEVGDDSFAVTLSFNRVAEPLTIPFEALLAFADPSVNFSIGFRQDKEGSTQDKDRDETEVESLIRNISSDEDALQNVFEDEEDENPSTPLISSVGRARAKRPDNQEIKKSSGKQQQAEIITIDEFRKK